jgi:hypothetical protein
MTRIKSLFVVAVLALGLGCGINSVSKRQLEAVKAGDVLTYRYQKGGKSWFYADKVIRVEGDKIYYNPSRNESTAGNDARLKAYDSSRELSMSKADLLKYETEQGEDRKVVIWIN